jgi:hypothetical protein
MPKRLKMSEDSDEWINQQRLKVIMSTRFLPTILYVMMTRIIYLLLDQTVTPLLIGPVLTFSIVGTELRLYSLSNKQDKIFGTLLQLITYLSFILLVIAVYTSYYNFIIMTFDVCWLIIAFGIKD